MARDDGKRSRTGQSGRLRREHRTGAGLAIALATALGAAGALAAPATTPATDTTTTGTSLPPSPTPRLADLEAEPTHLAQVVGENLMVVIHHSQSLDTTLDGERKTFQVRYASGMAVVDAPPERVRATVRDWANYPDFVPQTLGAEVLASTVTGETVAIELGFELPVIDLGVDYVAEYIHRPEGDETWTVTGGDLEGSVGRWEFLPLAGGRTLLVYTIWTNFDAMGFLVRTAFRLQPDLRVALPASTAAVVVRAIKERVEGRSMADPKPRRQPTIPLISQGDLPRDALAELAGEGTLIAVYPEQTVRARGQTVELPFVSAGALVDVPAETARQWGTRFERYPEFFDQVRSAEVRDGGKRVRVDWKLGLEFGFLSLPINYQLEYVRLGPHAWPFRRTAGDFEFLYGALEWLPVDADRSLIVYTTASAPGKRGAATLKIADMIPNNQMIAGVSAAAIVVERQGPWIEERAAEQAEKVGEIRSE